MEERLNKCQLVVKTVSNVFDSKNILIATEDTITHYECQERDLLVKLIEK